MVANINNIVEKVFKMCDNNVVLSLKPCGYILQAYDYKYIALQCCFCYEKWGNWKDFIDHQRENNCSKLEYIRNERTVELKKNFTFATGKTEGEATENHVSQIVEAYDDINDENCLKIGQSSPNNTENGEIFFSDASENTLPNDASGLLKETHVNENNLTIPNYELDSVSEISDNETDDYENTAKKFVINFVTVNKQTLDFIDCYHKCPCLWDPNHDYYNDLSHCEKALQEIAKIFKEKYNVLPNTKNLNTAIKRLNTFFKRYSYSSKRKTEARREYFQRCSFLIDIELDDRIQIKNISSKKIIFGEMDDYTIGFVEICEKYPVLWDSHHPDYQSNSKRKVAYDEIIRIIQDRFSVEFSKEEVYDSIHRLKQYYYAIVDKERKNEPLSKANLVYLERCKFLPPCKRKVQCHICERTLRSDATLQVHLLKEHNIGQLPFKCKYCELRFTIRAALKEHEIRAHTKQFEWFCKFCNKGFASRRDSETHELVHTGERKSVCEHCGRAFRLKHQMTEHVRIVHERIRCFKCHLCPKDFLRKRHLDDHLKGHLNIRDKVCEECGKTFTNQHALLRHKQLHAEKSYECKLCAERFHQFVGLRGHMKKKHTVVNNSDISEMQFVHLEQDSKVE